MEIPAKRWTEAAEETDRLLRRSKELIRERAALKTERVSLLRDVVAAARRFVDNVARRG